MIILALDTSGVDCTVALIGRASGDAEITEPIGRGHAERLAPMVDELLTQENIHPEQIDRIAVCVGPGSFTGLRVAIAFAKGFALPQRLPVIGLSAHHILAAHADPSKTHTVLSVINAKRGEVMWALYGKGAETMSPRTQKVDEARASIANHTFDIMVGDGAHLITGGEYPGFISGLTLANLAAVLDPAEYPPVPLYARGPDAKLPGGIDPA